MKRFYIHILSHLTRFCVFLLLLLANNALAQTTESADSLNHVAENQEPKISLLTCSPHQEVYSLYGHTALRVVWPERDMDVAVNYGMFSFSKPFFVLRFVFGLTDYEMGITSFENFCAEYRYYGSEVKEQELNLSSEEKRKILDALMENYQPENRVYRYNYFYDNCTTRARKMVTDNVSGAVACSLQVPKGMTFRKLIHQMTSQHPWAQLGNDLLLGVNADKEVNQEDLIFLPEWTAQALDKTTVAGKPIVKATTFPVTGQPQEVEPEFFLTPVQCALLILILSIIVSIIEWKKSLKIWWFDAILLTAQGLCGIVLTAMIFSQHPTVSLNLQILLFNPLPLFFGIQAMRRYLKGGKPHWMWLTGMILQSLMILLIAFNIQWIDPAVKIMACSLLLRYCMKIRKSETLA